MGSCPDTDIDPFTLSYSAFSLNRKTIVVLSLKGALFLIPSVSSEFNITINSNINRSSP